MSIDETLEDYLNRNECINNYNDLIKFYNNNSNATINALFSLINEEINSIEKYNIRDIIKISDCIKLIITNCEDINKKMIIRKIEKIIKKISISSTKESIRIKSELERLIELCKQENSKKYDFMILLIDYIKNIDYLEYTIDNIPSLVNASDKENVSLFRNVIKSYLNNIVNYNKDNILYYEVVISLMMAQKGFDLSDTEKKKCLDEIYICINKLSSNKKQKKKNIERLELLKNITSIIKNANKKQLSLEELTKKYNIKVDFSNSLLNSISLIKNGQEGYLSEREIVDDYIISIDDNKTIEIDDALSCEKLKNGNYLLGVHVASILGYFPYESEIVQTAISKNQSIYLPHKYQSKSNEHNKTIPIFPYEFSADIASLKEGQNKLTRTYFFEIDQDGNIINESFKKTIITNNKQLTYDEVNKIISKGTNNKKLQETINNLLDVVKILEKKYSGKSNVRKEKNESEKIVYQAMLLTGNRVAEYFNRNHFPLIYRIHYIDENNKELKEMIDKLRDTYNEKQLNVLYDITNEIYPKGWYGEKGKHTGLNLEHYCHCTSELRRAADIIVEHALEICYDNIPTEEDIKKLKEEIASKTVEINSKQTPIEYFLKEYKKKHKF